jgi:hypothetical protein
MTDGHQAWLEWQRVVSPDNRVEIDAIEADRGRQIGYVRVAGRRRADAVLDEPIASISMTYVKKPLLREAT